MGIEYILGFVALVLVKRILDKINVNERYSSKIVVLLLSGLMMTVVSGLVRFTYREVDHYINGLVELSIFFLVASLIMHVVWLNKKDENDQNSNNE